MPGGYLQNQLWIQQVPSYYTPAQIRDYLSFVRFNPLPTEDEIEKKEFARSAESLGRIVRAHLTTFPWENTGMHYSASHTMDVSPQGAFERFVKTGSGGSYCFGQNTVLLGILRGLGFRAYSGAARVNINWQKPEEQDIQTSHTHMVIFVQPDDESNLTYVVDVGFGGGGLARPIPLVNGDESIVMGVGPTEQHPLISMSPLTKGSSLASDGSKGQEVWTMQVRIKASADGTFGPWKRMYRFSELEFFLADYTDGSFVVAQSQVGIFAEQILCVKYFVDEEHPEHLYRMVVAGNRVTKQVPGLEPEVLRTFDSEQDRMDALREIFGLKLEEGAIENIKGRIPALT
ncbi:hypothetical protein MD484_g3769, partial [Candolleomyces efflorescens]